MSRVFAASAAALFAVLAVFPLAAHEGHDHGPPPAMATDGRPSFSAAAKHFEIVGVVRGSDLVLYIDGFADNIPVTGAEVHVAGDGQTAAATETSPGTYTAHAPFLTTPGEHRITVTASVGGRQDQVGALLAVASVRISGPGVGNSATRDFIRGGAIAAFGFGLALAVFRSGAARVGGAVIALIMTIVLFATAAMSHDQQMGAATNTTAAPHRHPDGAVFLPKPTQRLLEIRTIMANETESAASLELAGRVIADPNASGRAQAIRDGIVLPPEKGFPHVGQKVVQGEVLATLTATLSTFEEASLRQTLSQIERDMAALVPRADAVGIVNPTMPQSDATVGLLQELQIQSQALTRQKDLVTAALNQKIDVRAPVTGIVAAASATAGQAAAARETLFEIVDPDRIRVEGFGFDPIADDAIADATALTDDGRVLTLAFLGRGPVLQQQAAPLVFGVAAGVTVDVGTPLRIFVTQRRTLKGIRLPRAAVGRGPGNLPVVWEHTGAETFVPRAVIVTPLDAADVMVTGEVSAGMRLVTAGATFIGQVR
jgi:hypothetical protein